MRSVLHVARPFGVVPLALASAPAPGVYVARAATEGGGATGWIVVVR